MTPPFLCFSFPIELMSSSGYEPPYQWWPKTECMCGEATLPRHSYLHTNITLNGTFPDFDKSISSIASTNTKPYTSDGGRTWHIENSGSAGTPCYKHYELISPSYHRRDIVPRLSQLFRPREQRISRPSFFYYYIAPAKSWAVSGRSYK